MIWLIAFILIGLIPAAIAKNKGRDFAPWWIYGSLLFIVALPHALMMRPNREGVERRRVTEEGLRKCPHCAELVKAEAAICRYCERELPASPLIPAQPEMGAPLKTAPAPKLWTRASIVGLIVVLPVAGALLAGAWYSSRSSSSVAGPDGANLTEPWSLCQARLRGQFGGDAKITGPSDSTMNPVGGIAYLPGIVNGRRFLCEVRTDGSSWTVNKIEDWD